MTGVDGVIVHTEDEVRQQIRKVCDDSNIGILLINGALSKLCPDMVDDIRKNRSRPLLVEIPDRHGNGRDAGVIAEYIRTAVGVKI